MPAAALPFAVLALMLRLGREFWLKPLIWQLDAEWASRAAMLGTKLAALRRAEIGTAAGLEALEQAFP